jgi:two-component system chemotaxis response regulator CheY
MKAIVVDDSKAVRGILADALTGVGFEVVQAANGIEALERLNADPGVDLVLVDWNMPEMDGLQFAEAVHRDPALKGVRLMMVTMERSISHVSRAMRAGVDEYVTKPCSKNAIVERVRSMGFPV